MTVFNPNDLLYRKGDTDPVFEAPASATVIGIGDCVFLDPTSSKPEPASDMIDQGSAALNQDAFQQYFLGVAEQGSRSGDTAAIRIATKGTFEFDCAAATFNVGALVGLSENSGGTALEDKKVVAVASESLAIGRVAKTYGSNTTKVLVKIISTIMHGGVQSQIAGSSSGAI